MLFGFLSGGENHAPRFLLLWPRLRPRAHVQRDCANDKDEDRQRAGKKNGRVMRETHGMAVTSIFWRRQRRGSAIAYDCEVRLQRSQIIRANRDVGAVSRAMDSHLGATSADVNVDVVAPNIALRIASGVALAALLAAEINFAIGFAIRFAGVSF